MTTTGSGAARRPLGVVVLALLAVLVLLPGAGETRAAWVAREPVPGTALSSGVVDLRVGGQDALAAPSTLALAGMMPGQSVAAAFTVGNAGDVRLGYRLVASTTGSTALRDALVVTVTGAGSVTGSTPTLTCGGTTLAGSGTALTGGLLGSVASPRTLSAGASETVCVQLTLPSNAPSSLLATAVAVSLTFRADQVPARSWTDQVGVAAATLGTPAPAAPVLSCSARGLGFVTVSWTPVPGATGYVVNHGGLGALTLTVAAGTTSQTFVGVSGVATVRSVHGSSTWLGPASNSVTYNALSALTTGSCG